MRGTMLSADAAILGVAAGIVPQPSGSWGF